MDRRSPSAEAARVLKEDTEEETVGAAAAVGWTAKSVAPPAGGFGGGGAAEQRNVATPAPSAQTEVLYIGDWHLVDVARAICKWSQTTESPGPCG